MSALTSSDAKQAQESHGVYLSGGTGPNGEKFYLYIRTSEDEIARLNSDAKSNPTINFFEYGEVLNYGPGETPPPEIQQMVADKYGPKDDAAQEASSLMSTFKNFLKKHK